MRIMVGFILMAGLAAGCHSTAPVTVERSGEVTAGKAAVTLLGRSPEVGEQAPDFRVVDDAFHPVKLSDFAGKAVLISVVPSLDTGVCSLQTRRFNADTVKLGASVKVMTISMDLPFAQKRFCKEMSGGDMLVLSDSVWRDFGTKYGLVIKDRGFLARSVWVVGRDGKIVYRQIVPELSTQPDYEAAFKAAWDAM